MSREIDLQLRSAFDLTVKDINYSSSLLKELENYVLQELNYNQKLIVATYVTKLIIAAAQQQRFDIAEEVLFHYVQHLHVKVGESEKVTDIAANGLAIGIGAKKPKMIKAVFEEILGQDFTVESTDNSLLAFNLACFHARYNQKHEMLCAIKKSLSLGVNPIKFIRDSDFSAFQEDREFTKLIQGK